MRVVFGSEMKNVDSYTIEQTGIPSLVLMERAAYSFVEFFISKLKKEDNIAVVCGVGNNGADGLAAARMLYQKGFSISIIIVGKEEKATPQWKKQLEIITNLGLSYETFQENHREWSDFDWVVDALFGVGLSRELKGSYRSIVEEINTAKVSVGAIDIPSGVNGDDGSVMGAAICADFTVTFGAYKAGLLLYPGRELSGEVHVADIGLDEAGYKQICDMELYTKTEIKMPKRIASGNKGTYGKIYIIGGQKNMAGAVCFSAQAAYRCGAGLVKIQTVEENRIIIQTLVPQAILSTDDARIEENIRWADVIVMGPGLGTDVRWLKVMEKVLMSHKPVVLDADALNLIAENKRVTGSFLERVSSQHGFGDDVILTPHLGEMSRLIDKPIVAIQEALVDSCVNFQKEYGGICVLKDAVTLVKDSGRLYWNTTGNDGMAAGGSGDILTGMIAAFVFAMEKQGRQAGEGVKLAVYLHGLAGDLSAKQKGKCSMNAMDVIEHISQAIMEIEGTEKSNE